LWNYVLSVGERPLPRLWRERGGTKGDEAKKYIKFVLNAKMDKKQPRSLLERSGQDCSPYVRFMVHSSWFIVPSAPPEKVVLTGWRTISEQVINQIDHVSQIYYAITIHIPRFPEHRFRAILIKIID